MRWEYDGTLSDVYGNLTNVWTSLLLATPVPGTAPTNLTNPGAGYLAGYVVPNNFAKFYGTAPAGVFQSSRILPVQSGPPLNNFAPRFGFAYQALSHLVIRGGFGFFYDRVGGNQFVHSVEQGNPYAVTLDFSGSGNQPSSLQQLTPNVPLAFQPRWANLTNLTYSGLNLPLLDQTIHTPLTRQYNLNFQYEFMKELGAGIGLRGIERYQSDRLQPQHQPGRARECSQPDQRVHHQHAGQRELPRSLSGLPARRLAADVL